MITRKRQLKIEYDLDCIDKPRRRLLEAELETVLSKYGFLFTGSGAYVYEDERGVRPRDMGFERTE